MEIIIWRRYKSFVELPLVMKKVKSLASDIMELRGATVVLFSDITRLL